MVTVTDGGNFTDIGFITPTVRLFNSHIKTYLVMLRLHNNILKVLMTCATCIGSASSLLYIHVSGHAQHACPTLSRS